MPVCGGLEAWLRRMAALRGVGLVGRLQLEVADSPDFEDLLLSSLTTVNPRARLEELHEISGWLGLQASTIRFEDGLKLQASQLAAYYVPGAGRVILRPSAERAAVEHELLHYLQDLAYQLTPRARWTPLSGDALTAWQCLAEGDAAWFAETHGAAARPEPTASSFDGGTVQGATWPERKRPSFLERMQTAVYLTGRQSVARWRVDGGWLRVAQVWSGPSLSTQQLLHPVSGGLRESLPEPLEVSRVTGPLAGAKLGLEDVLGELQLRVALEGVLSSEQAAALAAMRVGDRLTWFHAGPTQGLVWRIRFTTADGARSVAPWLAKALALPPESCLMSPTGARWMGVLAADITVLVGTWVHSEPGRRTQHGCHFVGEQLGRALGLAPWRDGDL